MSIRKVSVAAEIGGRVRAWFDDARFQSVQLLERSSSVNPATTEEDYFICFEQKLLPEQPWCLSAEIWFTSEGHVGVGIGSYGSLASWLGIATFRHGFIAGFEPVSIDGDQVLGLLRACSLGLPRIQWPAATRLLTDARLSIEADKLTCTTGMPKLGTLDLARFKVSRGVGAGYESKPWQ